jgi:hypothetical protein
MKSITIRHPNKRTLEVIGDDGNVTPRVVSAEMEVLFDSTELILKGVRESDNKIVKVSFDDPAFTLIVNLPDDAYDTLFGLH